MVIGAKQLEDGSWRAGGYPGVNGYGKTEDEAIKDFFKKLDELLERWHKKSGYRIHVE